METGRAEAQTKPPKGLSHSLGKLIEWKHPESPLAMPPPTFPLAGKTN